MKSIERAIVVGASSGIGRAVAEELLAHGVDGRPCRVALVARRKSELDAVAAPHNPPASGGAEGDKRALVYAHDVRDYGAVPGLFQEIAHALGGVDLVVYASGVMPTVEENEYTFAKDEEIISVNVLGAMAWLDESARRFSQLKSGTIVGISSIAGERGRRGNPAYSTSKAALTTYLESLRNRVSRFGVRVVTIKPGFIDTDMVRGKPGLIWLISAEEAARLIVSAVRKGKGTAYVPARWRFVAGVLKIIPSFVFRHLPV